MKTVELDLEDTFLGKVQAHVYVEYSVVDAYIVGADVLNEDRLATDFELDYLNEVYAEEIQEKAALNGGRDW